MSGLDFSVLVSQSSNSFYLNVFLQVLFSLILTTCKGDSQLMASGSCSSTGVFWKVQNKVSLSFRLKSSNCFPVKTNVSDFPSFFVLLLCTDGAFSGSTLLTPLFFGSMKLTPLFSQFNAVNAVNAVNAAIFPVHCRQRHYFSVWLPLASLATSPVECHWRRYFSGSTPLMPLFSGW